MNLNNKQIRAHARHLLDDNVFGWDWIKGAFIHFVMDFVTTGLARLLSEIASVVLAVLVVIAIDNNSLLFYGFSIFFLYLMIPLILCAIWGPLSVGAAAVYIDLVRGDGNIRIRKYFSGFKYFIESTVIAIMYVLQVVLWSLFFIIPGIYMAYSFALVFHVKRDHPEYRWKQCFDESEELMRGNRWKLFKLQISHIGWFLLGLAFLLIGSYWTMPYYNTSMAIFYEELRAEKSIR